MADESKSVEKSEQEQVGVVKQKNDYEIFWDRIKEKDRVLVKAPIATQPSKTCYFLGTIKAKSRHIEDENHVVVIQLEGEKDRRAIKLENIGSIEYVKKTIIPMDFIFKDENIKAGEIKTENEKIKAEFDCKKLDTNCDGDELGKGDLKDLEDDDGVLDLTEDTDDEFKDVKDIGEEEIETGSSGQDAREDNQEAKKRGQEEAPLSNIFYEEGDENFNFHRDWVNPKTGSSSMPYHGGKKKKKRRKKRSRSKKRRNKRKNRTKKN